MTYQAKAAQHKKDAVKALSMHMQEYPVVGLVNVENLPSRQLQVLRAKLRKDVLLAMTKKGFINRAINSVKDSKKNFEKLSESITGMPAVLFTKQNPFKVSAIIQASKSKAPAKPGQVAPYDLIIPAGPTSFTPGPIISELGAAGLKTGVENGKITIKQDAVIVREGEVIDNKAADILAKFNIEPMEIGLDLVAAYEDGLVYGRDVLSVSKKQYIKMIQAAASDSLGLSVEIAYPTKENIERLVATAYNTAKNFALNQDILSDVVLEKEIGEASRAADSIAKSANIDTATETKGEVKEKPKEEKKKEPEKKEVPAAPDVEEEEVETKPEPKPEQKVKAEEKKEEKKKEPDLSQAEKLSREFEDEIADEKKRRNSIDASEAEKLAKQLKKKGTLRKE